MTPAAGVSRFAYLCGSTAVIGAVAYAVARSSLPPSTWLLEAGLFALGSVYALVVIWQQGPLMGAPPWLSSLQGSWTMALATAILAVAAPHIALAMPLSYAVLLTTILATILNSDPADRRRVPRPLFALLPVAIGITIVWWRWSSVPRPDALTELVTWGGLLVGTGLLMDVHWSIGRARLGVRMDRIATLSSVAHQLGGATELDDIAAAVLQAFTDTYPSLNHGGILLWNEVTESLEALPIALSPAGVGRIPAETPRGVGIRRGEGVAGEAFATGAIVHRGTAGEARADDRNRRHALNRQITDSVGHIRSAIGVPLRSGSGEVVGVVSMGSTTSEHDWSPNDLVMARSIGDQAGIALERGLLYDSQKRRAITDALTQLPNRREFDRIVGMPSPEAPFTILAIDLDNLKMINDEYGHEAGDAVLRVVARAIRAALRGHDHLARVGGDEFAALLPATDEPTGLDIADRLARSMEGVAVPYGVARLSIGCAAGRPGDDARSVWLAADEALYRAKVAGRNRVAVNVREHHGANGHHQRWTETVPKLLERREMTTVFQPVVDLQLGDVVGYEALARPPRHSGETVEGLFRAAVRMGLGRDLDWLCRRSAVANARFAGPDALLFLNVGVPALLDPLHDVDQMLLLLHWAGLSPERVVLEVTERESVTDHARFRAVLAAYREHGFRFAMDDVGEGHSTLELLAAGVPEFIKIAQSLTRAATQPGPHAAIRALQTFAEHRGALLIAEGIEGPADVETMTAIGVRYGQGYHLGRPVPADALDGRAALTASSA